MNPSKSKLRVRGRTSTYPHVSEPSVVPPELFLIEVTEEMKPKTHRKRTQRYFMEIILMLKIK